MSNPERQYSFSEVTLYKDQVLGVGSYGSVCKAKCDTLTCAAKIIHAVLFDLADPGVRNMMRRFEQECQLLSAIKHHTDKDTGLPVLLMELMDNNLTHYLETSTQPLPLHIQINFSLDIATALAYLHSNTILHRDLSSNNVLLLAERRAKVTDFGMSQLERVYSRMTPATQCPGTPVYMPPETLKERPRPHHTDKLDIFSFGVLLVQILTRKFPKPSERFTSLQVPDPRDNRRMTEAQFPVKEVNRRQNHISLVEDSPLLNISLTCLEDKHEDRPPASLLCAQLEELRSLDTYRRSAEVNYKTDYHRIKEELDQKEASIREIRETLAQKEACIGEIRETLAQKEACIGEIRETLAQKEASIGEIRETLAQKEACIREITVTLSKKETCIEEIRDKLAKTEDEMKVSKQLANDKDYVIQEKDRIIRAQETKLTKPNDISLRWRRTRNAPVKFKGRGHTAVVGKVAYFLELTGCMTTLGEEKKIYQYNTETESWDTLPDPPKSKGFTIVTIYNLFLTTIGGYDNNKGKLYTYEGRQKGKKWVKKFPPMGSLILEPSVTSTHNSVIVISTGSKFNYHIAVSVLDLQTLQWTHFQPQRYTPTYYTSAFMFVNDNTLYHAGGIGWLGPGPHFFSCPLHHIENDMEWTELQSPTSIGQAVTCFKGQILGIGGGTKKSKRDQFPDMVPDIHRYDSNLDTWVKFDEMEMARAHCMVAVVGNKMIVVGNDSSEEDTSITHIATIA